MFAQQGDGITSYVLIIVFRLMTSIRDSTFSWTCFLVLILVSLLLMIS